MPQCNQHFPAPDNMQSEVTDLWLSNEPKRIPTSAVDQKLWHKQSADLGFCLFRVNHSLFGTNEAEISDDGIMANSTCTLQYRYPLM
jgi:hypothetical protein